MYYTPTGSTIDVLTTLKHEQVINTPPSLTPPPCDTDTPSSQSSNVKSPVNVSPITKRNIFHRSSSSSSSRDHSPVVSCPKYLSPQSPASRYKIVVTFIDHFGNIYGQPVTYGKSYSCTVKLVYSDNQ